MFRVSSSFPLSAAGMGSFRYLVMASHRNFQADTNNIALLAADATLCDLSLPLFARGLNFVLYF
jgi:hypothetical protein